MGKANLSLESLLEQQRSSWKGGQPVKIEEFIRRFPALKEREEALIDLMYAEILLREENGESPQRSDYTLLFPYLKEQIDRQFQVHEALDIPVTPQAEIATSVDGAETIPSRGIKAHGKHSVMGFELLEVVGRGGSGIAYKARDEKLHRTVVIKFLLATGDDQANKRLLHEASASASLVHPSIVQVFHVGVSDENPYMVMEYVAGGSLAERLQNGPLTTSETVKIGRQISDAIEFAHSKSIIHRDLKPGNILLGSDSVPQVADFGLARKVGDESLHATGDVLGTPAYMSPEQAKGQPADARSDVYSIGAVLYEMLCGRSPFDAATPWDILHQVTTTDPVALRQLNASIPKDLETICQKCLEKDPQRRYQSAQLLADDLTRFENGEPILARPVNAIQRTAKWCRRKPWLAGLAATSLGLLLALAVGSTYAALELSTRNETIKREQQLNKQARIEAEDDREAAVEALWQLVDSLYEDLSNNAATIATREKVVNAAIEGLESISQFQGTTRFDRTAVLAHRRIAELHALRGDNDEALREYLTSVDMAKKIAEQEPNDIQLQLDVVRSLDAMTVFQVGLNNHKEVAEIKSEVQDLLDQLRKKHPDNKLVFKNAVVAYSREMDYLWMNQPPEVSVRLGEAAAADVAKLIELDPEDESAYLTGYHIHSRLGRANIEAGDLEGAESHWQFSRDLIEHLMEVEPENPNYIYCNAVLHRMESTATLARSDFDASLNSLDQSLVLFRALSKADEDDIRWKQNVGNSLVMRSQTLTAAGRFEEALDGFKEGKEIHLKNAEKVGFNNLTRGLLAQIENEKSMIFLRQRKWAKAQAASAEMMVYVDGENDQEPMTSMPAQYVRALAPLTKNATDVMQGEDPSSDSPDAEATSLFLAGCVEAESSTSDELSTETKELIQKINPDLNLRTLDELVDHIGSLTNDCMPMMQPNVASYQCRILSLRGKHLDEATEMDAAARKARQLELAERIDTLFSAAAESNPLIKNAIRTEFELRWFVGTETYANSSLNQ